MPCEVRIISGRELQALFDSDPKMMLHRSALPLATNGTQERADTEEPIQDGLWARPRPLPLHRPQPLPSAHRPLSAGGADALAEGHRLVPQHHAQLSEHTPQGNDVRSKSRGLLKTS